MYINYSREGAKQHIQMQPASFQQCPITGQKARDTNQNIQDCLWTLGNIFSLWGGNWAPAKVAQGGCSVSILRDTQKSSGYSPGHPAPGDPAWARRLGKTASRCPQASNPKLSVILCFCSVGGGQNDICNLWTIYKGLIWVINVLLTAF